MLTLVPNIIPSFIRALSRPPRENQHLMLAGLHQTIFLNQWGEPETQVGLRRLGSFNKLGSFLLVADTDGEAPHSVWIYKKRNKILFFTKKKLVSHSRWTEFREKEKERKRASEGRFPSKSSPLLSATLPLVA